MTGKLFIKSLYVTMLLLAGPGKRCQNKETLPRFHDNIAASFVQAIPPREASRRTAPETSALWRESSKPALRWIDTAPRGSVMGVADS